jgi:hypothetical protein
MTAARQQQKQVLMHSLSLHQHLSLCSSQQR